MWHQGPVLTDGQIQKARTFNIASITDVVVEMDAPLTARSTTSWSLRRSGSRRHNEERSDGAVRRLLNGQGEVAVRAP
jgi:hypothetical protein